MEHLKSKQSPKLSSKTEANDVHDVYIDLNVLSPTPSTPGFHSDVFKAPHGGKRTDSEESNDHDNNQEPIQRDCELDTLSKSKEGSNPEHKEQLTTVNRGRDTPLGSAAHIQGNE